MKNVNNWVKSVAFAPGETEPEIEPGEAPNTKPEIEPEVLPKENPGIQPGTQPEQDDDDDDDPFTETEIGDNPDEIGKKTTIMQAFPF